MVSGRKKGEIRSRSRGFRLDGVMGERNVTRSVAVAPVSVVGFEPKSQRGEERGGQLGRLRGSVGSGRGFPYARGSQDEAEESQAGVPGPRSGMVKDSRGRDSRLEFSISKGYRFYSKLAQSRKITNEVGHDPNGPSP